VRGDLSVKRFRCPSCDAEIEGGPYCRFCGQRVDFLSSKNEEKASSSDIPVIEFDIPFSDSDFTPMIPLLSRVELTLIDEELKDIIEQIQASRQALNLESVESDQLTVRAEELRKQFEALKKRKELLLKASDTTLIEDLIQSLLDVEEKQSRLEDAPATLEKEVYKEQKNRLKNERKTVRAQLKQELKTLEHWAKEFRRTQNDLRKNLGQLDAKFKIGEISRSFYDSKRLKLVRSLSILENALARIDELRTDVKSKT
jgi:hypothetical protein